MARPHRRPAGDPRRAAPARARQPPRAQPCAAGSATTCAASAPRTSTPPRATRCAAGRSRATARCSPSSATSCAAARAPSRCWCVLNALAAGSALVVPRLLGVAGQPGPGAGRGGRGPRRARPHGGGRRGAPVALHLRCPAHLDPLRPGPAGLGARVRRRHDPAAARRARRGREHRRPRHPRHPRRRHDGALGAVGRAPAADLADDGRAVGRGDAAQLRRARPAGAGGLRAVHAGGAHLPAARAQGVHHRGRDVLPDQHHPHRDRRGRPHRRGARPVRRPGARRRRRHRGLRAGRALRHDAAQRALRRAQRRLPGAAGGHARGGRLRLQPRLGRPRPDHRRDALRRRAQRAARRRHRRGRPAPGGCRVDQPAARHRRGAARPRARRPAPRRRRAGGRGPALRLPRGPRRAARRRPAPAHRRAAGRRRSERVGQVHARPAAVGHQPPAHRAPRASAASTSSTCRWRCCAPRSRW